MKFIKTTFNHPLIISEAAVVIDVCRAFTTAAFAFSNGAQRILLVRTVQEAFELRSRFPDALLLGEENGLPVKGFDLWNSPSLILDHDLKGVTLIQRTTAGTRGMVAYRDTPNLLAGTFANAGATISYLKSIHPKRITFLTTGVQTRATGEEDNACADYFIDQLSGRSRPISWYMDQVDRWQPEIISTQPDLLKTLHDDLELCKRVNCFNFVMKASKEDDLLVLRPFL